jgi:hypothetical protein
MIGRVVWIILLCSLLLLGIVYHRRVTDVLKMVPILVTSLKFDSFYSWADHIRNHTMLSFTYNAVPVPAVPHIILLNHIQSHVGLGSVFAAAGAVTSPVRIVCYTARYYEDGFAYGVSYVMNRILQHEIAISQGDSPVEKQCKMVRGIQDALDDGKNVAMFIDGDGKAMRSLYKAVLTKFPTTLKQLTHIHEPIRSNRIHIERSVATTDLDQIIRERERVCGGFYWSQ